MSRQNDRVHQHRFAEVREKTDTLDGVSDVHADSLYSRKPVKIPPNTMDTHSSRETIATNLLKTGRRIFHGRHFSVDCEIVDERRHQYIHLKRKDRVDQVNVDLRQKQRHTGEHDEHTARSASTALCTSKSAQQSHAAVPGSTSESQPVRSIQHLPQTRRCEYTPPAETPIRYC